MPTNVFVVDDHALVREMLAEYIGMMDGLAVCGQAASGEEALERLPGQDVDLVLVDVSLPGMSGPELIARLLERAPGLVCLAYSGHLEGSYVERALAAGARGYVAKGDPYQLEEGIRRVLAGETYLSETFRSG